MINGRTSSLCSTKGLRDLQGKEQLQTLLSKLQRVRDQMDEETEKRQQTSSDTVVVIVPTDDDDDDDDDDTVQRRRTPLLVKIAPDLTSSDRRDIAAVCVEVGIDGIIISNTTVARPSSLKSEWKVTRERERERESGSMCLYTFGFALYMSFTRTHSTSVRARAC